jgi:glycosyltransferase involved in cell wall biosynthesis
MPKWWDAVPSLSGARKVWFVVNSPVRLLYVDCYTRPKRNRSAPPSSMALGYGVTASGVIQRELRRAGFDLVTLTPPGGAEPDLRRGRLRWILRSYVEFMEAVAESSPHAVLVFHTFGLFPAELRRILLELESNVPMLGYTHGSHWDHTDSRRLDRYPGMQLTDLGNLAALDCVLFNSETAKRVILDNVAAHNATTARQIARGSLVAGLPLDTALLDATRTDERFPVPTVVFNHAINRGKDPALFARVADRVLADHAAQVLFTRGFEDTDDGATEIRRLARRHPGRVTFGGDLDVKEYYRALWMSDIQVSTARHESLGIATLEAMYTGNCCLLPRRGSYPEITADDAEALYDSAEELEHRLRLMLADGGRRRRLGARLSARARSYAPETVMPPIVAKIRSLIRCA